MKKLLCIALVCCVGTYVHAQNKIKYTYDNAGNRIKKEIVLSSTRSILSEEDEQAPYIEEMLNHEIKIYPNPTKGILNIKIAGQNKVNGQISIYNIVGKLIEKTELSDSNQTFDLSAQPNGIYIMQIKIEDKVSSWKIIKE
ncbi:T9SS type A sorting domain-containing protein [Bacteroides timonensis]|uniref:T9SS type A sorting domain-containing protein n=1 Tax=Bacteroides timonensis TaxID=1470345 RepID=UPI0004B77DAA|nr:T9SS type A sorting domain-containing protein [Bacteroides timonensis]